MVRSRVSVCIWVFGVLVLASGCEVKNALDTKKVEKNIQSELEKQTGIKAKEVSCPSTVWEKKGDTFQCEATAEDGSKIKIDVTMEGEGKVRWKTKDSASKSSSASAKPTEPKPSEPPPTEAKMLNTKAVEAHIAQELEKQTGTKPSAVLCPADIVEKKGEVFTCKATADDGSSAMIEVTMTGDGNVSWKTLGGPPPPPEPPEPE